MTPSTALSPNSTGVAALGVMLGEILAPHLARIESGIQQVCAAVKPACDNCAAGKPGCAGGQCNTPAATSTGVATPVPVAASTGVATPTGGPLCTAESVAGQVTSNCMAGPPNETPCTRASRQLAKSATVYQFSVVPGAFGEAAGIGYSAYTAPGTNDVTLMLNIPAEDLAAIVSVCEFEVSVTNPGAGTFNYAAGPAGMVSARSAWYATEDNVVEPVSQSSGQVFGRKLLTHDGHCSCACVKGWSPYDKSVQIEFTIPGLTAALVVAGSQIDVRFEAERTYAVLPCAFPAKCSEPDYAAPRQLPLT